MMFYVEAFLIMSAFTGGILIPLGLFMIALHFIFK